MRYFFGLIIIILASWSASKPVKDRNRSSEPEPSYQVYKIDSINNWYLIYAKKGDSLYKIVSKKALVDVCNKKVQVSNRYNFQLHSSIYGYTIGGKRMMPQNSLLVTCFSFDKATTICIERDSINDLHYSDNLKGLCIIN